MANKIEKHKLTQRVLALYEQKRTTAEIADILTEELGGADTISQATVSRFLKPYREEYKEQARDKVSRHINEKIENDLAAMDEVEAFFFGLFKDKDVCIKERGDAGLKALKVIETKLRYALIDSSTGASTCHPVDLSAFRADLDELKERDNG